MGQRYAELRVTTLADHALAMGHEDLALTLIEEAFAACDSRCTLLELAEAA